MRRVTPLVVLCSLVLLITLAAADDSAAAARARFRFGRGGARPAPVARNVPGPGVNDWVNCGVTLTPANTYRLTFQAVLPTTSGGSLTAWSDMRNGNFDCFATKLDGTGNRVSGWGADGNAISLSDSGQLLVSSGSDNAGGAFFVYTNVDTDFTYNNNAFLQHLTSSGAVAGGYPANGKTLITGDIGTGGMIADGSGGLFFGWSTPNGSNIRITRLDATGAATAGWPAGGIDTGLPDGVNGEPELDGAGGLYFAFSTATTVNVQRYTSTGVASGWPAQGVVVATPGSETNPRLIRLSNNDALVAWVDPATTHVFAMRVNAAGAVNGSWPAGGKQISTSAGNESDAELVADGAGGVLLQWIEESFIPTFGTPMVQRLTSAGAVAAGWPAAGVPLSSQPTDVGSSNLIGDGANGAIAAWADIRGGDADVYAMRVLATGAVDAGWTTDGAGICTKAGDQAFPQIVSDGANGAIVTFQDYSDQVNPLLRVSRLLSDGTVSALASLADATAEPGRVELHWYTPDGSVSYAAVERAEAGGEFTRIGEVTADGAGHLRFEDRDVTAGITYQYRLAVTEGATVSYLGMVTIHVPSGISLAIAGFRPNPSEGEVGVVFTLESAAPARLEMLDVAGRRVMSREVGMLGPGQHVLPLEQAKGLSAGIYVLRLTQSGREVVARSAIVR